MIKKIAVTGGDKRLLFAARELIKNGFEVELGGFDNLLSYGDLKLVDTESALVTADAVLFPITGIKGNTISCPFSDGNITVEPELLRGKVVFGGKGVENFANAFNLAARDDFKTANALVTAEGAVQTAMESYEGTINGSRCLVIGFGKIGGFLSEMLLSLKSEVTVSTRRESGKTAQKGYNLVYTEDIDSLDGYDIVFNTADALIVDEKVLKNTDGDPLIIDLASLPGGVDFSACDKLGFTAIRALGLPGKCSPAAAGKIISDTILTVLREEFNWKKPT